MKRQKTNSSGKNTNTKMKQMQPTQNTYRTAKMYHHIKTQRAR